MELFNVSARHEMPALYSQADSIAI